MYAIIVTGGKQYRVEQGDIVYFDKAYYCLSNSPTIQRYKI